MNIFISGGAKNGKSYFAQKIAREMAGERGLPLYYIATMIPHDSEDLARIERHIKERDGWGFTTIEEGFSVSELKEDGVFLLDSVTALLANNMFRDDGADIHNAVDSVKTDLIEFARTKKNVVFVSDYIYGNGFPKTVNEPPEEIDYTDRYMRGLAEIDLTLAQICDRVYEVIAGKEILHKDE